MSNSSALAMADIVVTLAGAGLFIVCAISYVRAVNALSSHLDIERLDALRPTPNWLLRVLFVDFYAWPRRFFGDGRLSDLILGLRVLDRSDQRCRRLLWLARKRLIACLVLFLAGVIGVGWLFQNVR